MQRKRIFGFLFFRNLLLAVFVGLLTGVVTEAVSSRKKGKSQDLSLGIGGAILATLGLALLRGGIRLIPLLIVQFVGALLLILVGRLVASGK